MADQVKVLMIAEDKMTPAFIKAGKSADALDQKLDHMGGTMGSTGRSGSSLAGVLQTGIGVALGGLIFSAAGAATQIASMGISFNAMKQNAQVAFSTILGSGEKATKLMAELQQFAAETPFAFEELAAATKSLIAFGIEGDKSVETLRRLGDIASGVGAPLNDIAQIYGKARVQGRLFAEDINQLTGRGIPIIQELAKQFDVAESEISKMVENGEVGFQNLEKAIVDLTSQGGKFSGMMEAQSKTFDGMMSTLMDNLNQLAGVLAKPLFDTLIIGLEQVNALLGGTSSLNTGGFGAWLGELGGAINTAVSQINEALAPALAELQPIFDELGRTIGPIINAALRALGDELVQRTIPNFAAWVVYILKTIPPTVEFAKVVGGAILDGLRALGVVWANVNNTIQDGLKWITETHDAFTALVADLVGPIAEGFQWFIDNVIAPFTQALAALKRYIGEVIAALANLAGKIGAGIPSLPSAADVGGAFNNAVGGIFGGGGASSQSVPNNFNSNRTTNQNVNIVLPNVRTERDAIAIGMALQGLGKNAILRDAQGLH